MEAFYKEDFYKKAFCKGGLLKGGLFLVWPKKLAIAKRK